MGYPSESFEKYIVPALFAPWASYLIRLADPQPRERVLDVACGTGIVARRIAPMVGPNGTVAGLDFNPNMIQEAHAAAGREGLSIDFREGKAEALPFPDGSFDLVTCQFGLMLFSDGVAALTEMHRVLTSGGRLVLSVWQSMDCHPFYQTLHEVSVKRLETSGVDGVYSLSDADELRRLLTDAGFQDVEIEPVSMTARFPNPEEFLIWEIGVDQSSIPSMQHLNVEEWQAVLDAIRRDLQGPLVAAMQDDQLVLPFHAHLARARRTG